MKEIIIISKRYARVERQYPDIVYSCTAKNSYAGSLPQVLGSNDQESPPNRLFEYFGLTNKIRISMFLFGSEKCW